MAKLVGISFNITTLKPNLDKATIQKNIIQALIDFVAIVAVIYNATVVARETGVEKASIIGAITYLFAVVIPRVVVEPTLDKFCKPCSQSGRFGVGFVVLIALCVLNWLNQYVMLLK